MDEINTVTPEQMAQKAFHSNSLVWSPYMIHEAQHKRYQDEILRLTTEAGKKK